MIYFFHQYYLIPSATTFQDKLFNKSVILESKYYSWLQIVLLPVYSLVSYLIFKRTKNNYAEWIVICCYLMSFVLILQIPFYILDSFIRSNDTIHLVTQLLITELYTFYALNSFLKHKMNWRRYIYILIGVVINFFIFVFYFSGNSISDDYIVFVFLPPGVLPGNKYNIIEGSSSIFLLTNKRKEKKNG
jgi:hypothetical protein